MIFQIQMVSYEIVGPKRFLT